MTTGRLCGIARHDRPRGPMETVDAVSVSREEGLHGDYRGTQFSGPKNWRQGTLIEARGWADAMADLGLEEAFAIPWQERRANLLVDGLRLPREVGAIVAVGKTLRLEITDECNPCSRMDAIRPGLKAALTPDWRGGALARVLTGGDIAVGDEVRIEE
ncbi:molybdenum cofactor biosysynthesis protein [Novosphingobium marinum]|uniref:MOSC domain-containing protein YiiM n=1 Tax=Novosphingobium marinum TaxID=1514948 RepID=A0A7Y9XWQ2_9SPHN|nr:MOSC domain-containing protein [Novosphingobium marinum]NYH94468.1 MOSC domain-containing protein YiiM [Novosphingobium marinum]GGC22545.1 molybdenum cofactor biosysynthesis protein [Novosphingobium marinum]